jgi:hypothetical protein
MNSKKILRKALCKPPRRGRASAFIAVSLSVLLLAGGVFAAASPSDYIEVPASGFVYVEVQHIYDKQVGTIKSLKLAPGEYVIDELNMLLNTLDCNLEWDFIPGDDGSSTIVLEVGSVYP